MLNILIEFLKYKTFNKHKIYQESLISAFKNAGINKNVRRRNLNRF